METGLSTRQTREAFVEDCTIETDQQALIPDEYIDMTAEKIRIYKNLDSMTSDKEIDRMARQLEDRFGALPQEVSNLLDVVKIRNLGASMGFEKIIIKNGMQIMFFVGNPMSGYYKSGQFSNLLDRVNLQSQFKFNQDNGKLRVVTRGVDSLAKALANLKLLQ